MSGLIPTQKTDRSKPARPVVKEGACAECGAPYASPVRETLFCSRACKTTFTNRVMRRAIPVYHLLMACRFERDLAKQMNLWSHLCSLCSSYWVEDQETREKRPSWLRPQSILARVSYIFSKKIG